MESEGGRECDVGGVRVGEWEVSVRELELSVSVIHGEKLRGKGESECEGGMCMMTDDNEVQR